MAFKLTYSDGQESEYGDDTVWEVDNGVLKMGKQEGNWSVLLSPSHWAVIELGGAAPQDDAEDDDDQSDDTKGGEPESDDN
jgi:hypothetical protein